VCLSSSPCGQGTAPSFYRPRGGGLQSCRTVLITCSGMVYSVVELMAVLAISFPPGVAVSPVPTQGRLRGRLSGDFLFGRRPYADSRVRLTGGRRAHSGRRGSVLSSRIPTVSGMVLQCPGWCRGSGDGRTGLMVTEETCPTGPTSWRRPGRARDRRPSPFRGLRRPLSRVWRTGRTRVGSTVSRS
jgi:hypothetical protein